MNELGIHASIKVRNGWGRFGPEAQFPYNQKWKEPSHQKAQASPILLGRYLPQNEKISKADIFVLLPVEIIAVLGYFSRGTLLVIRKEKHNFFF